MTSVHLGYFGCDECHVTFKEEDSLIVHKTYHGQNFVCDKCGFETKEKFKLKNHETKVHVNKKEKVQPTVEDLTCKDCVKTFDDKEAIKRHMKTVHNPSPCPHCGKVVKVMRVHINTMHKDDSEKKYKCQICAKGFPESNRVRNHMMNVHIKARPYQCRYNDCDNTIGFNDVSNRNAHENRKHGKRFA